ncbi:MAG: histidine kinase, partial [Bacteroidota bacterium]
MTEGSTASQLGDLIRQNKHSVYIGFAIAVMILLVLFGFEFWYYILNNGKFNVIIFATNTIGFLLIWLVSAFLVARLSAYKVLGVFSLLVIVVTTLDYLKLPINNPISMPSLLLFWFGIAYLLIPEFIKRHKVILVSMYGAALLYFYIFRTAANYEEVHVKVLSYFLTITISFTFIIWIYQQLNWLISVKLNQTHAELQLLKSQVNPHFFFNTLNNLYGLVVEKSEQAPEMVLKLSDMMRYTIYEGKEDVVSLTDEIQYLKNYIELHKIRHQKSVDIRFEHDVQSDLKVAPLLFIILLENAFKHGVEGLTENAFIRLELVTAQKQL